MRGWRSVVAGAIAAMVVVVVAMRCRHATTPPSEPAKSTSGAGQSVISSRGRDAGARPKPPPGGLRLEGQVIDENDQPVAGATVRFYNFDHETQTAEDGSFVFERLGPHEYQVTAEKGEDTYCEMVRTQLSETSEPVILRLHPGAVATVHVVDADGAKPIAGARLGLRITDANGDVRVRGLQPGGSNVVIIGVEADGYESTRAKLTNLDLANPADNVFTVEMRRGVAVSGTVVGPNGEAVAEVLVTARAATGYGRGEADTNAAGAWTMTLAPGSHEINASATGFEDAAPLAIEIDAARSGVVIRLQRSTAGERPTLSGVVVDQEGKPAAWAVVYVEAPSFVWNEQADEDGRFTVSLAPGTTTVEVNARKGNLSSEKTDVGIVGGRADLRLVLAPSAIAGIVVDRRGRPAPGVRVFLRAFISDADAISDAKGRFELGGLPPGDYQLFVAHTEEQYAGVSQGVMASTGAKDVRLVVTDVGNVTGRVVLDGKPATYFGAYVSEADPILDRPVISRSSDGRFAIKGILAGTWTIVVAGPGFARKTIKGVVVPEDGEVELGDIAVDRGRVVRGRVTDASGAGVSGATVTIHDSDPARDALTRALQGTGIATTDAAGAYRITALAPPLYDITRRIVATHPTRGVSLERALAEAVTEMNLVLVKPGGIDGRLEGLDTGVTCHRVDDPSYVLGVAPDSSGKFHFDNLVPGQYRLRPNGLAAVVAIVTVVGGQRAIAALRVPPERIELPIVARACKTIALATEDGLDTVADQSCGSSFSNVPPGNYRVCIDDDKQCTPITVAPTPAKQTVIVR